MSTYSLHAGCQALDLQNTSSGFQKKKKKKKKKRLKQVCQSHAPNFHPAFKLWTINPILQYNLEACIRAFWDRSGKRDIRDRCNQLADDTLPIILRYLGSEPSSIILEWRSQCREVAFAAWELTFFAFCTSPNTYEKLGLGSRKLYRFVGEELGVSFHEGLVEHPPPLDAHLAGVPKRSSVVGSRGYITGSEVAQPTAW